MKVLKEYRFRDIGEVIDFITLSILALGFISYSIWYRDFAEFNLRMPFLNFPIFIGEIILFICMGLMILKWVITKRKFKWLNIILFMVYLGFMLLKTSYGYSGFGPFALRHAAMFYYPLFALISYQAYNKKFINNSLLLPFILIAVLGWQQTYYNFTYLMLILIYFINAPWIGIKKVTLRNILKIVGLGVILLLFQSTEIIYCCRTQLIGHLAGFLILFILLFKIAKIKALYKKSLGIIILLIFIMGLIKYNEDPSIRSLTALKSFRTAMKQWDALVDSRRDYYVEHDIEPKLYNPNQEENLKRHEIKRGWSIKEKETDEPKEKETVKVVFLDKDEVGKIKNKSLDQLSDAEKTDFETTLIHSYNTAILRLFIWRDMYRELKDQKAFLGLSFGKPLRSKTVELSDMIRSIWSRDGWISSHNSYAEIIYRSGVVGLGLILTVLVLLFWMMITFVKYRSLPGVFLISIIVYWLTTTFIYVTLEMPYSAIFFWSLFGLSLAYSRRLRIENIK